MEGHGEAAADVVTGGVIASAIEPDAGTADRRGEHENCRNCGAALSGPYCSNCGQPAHLHRSLASLGHDILHGVFHFEGKVWRTIPELMFHPGRLTRRYIEGERARFVSPLALYLFTVFLTFAVFSFTSGSWRVVPEGVEPNPAAQWKSNITEQIEEIDEEIDAIQERLEEEELGEAKRAQLQQDLADKKSARDVMDAMVKGEWSKIAEIEREQNARRQAEAAATAQTSDSAIRFKTRWPKLDSRLNALVQDTNDNPKLLLYKLKTAGYKYSWALIPLSVPFMWLLFFWRRDIHSYDHAVFVTYSICFMMLFAILLSISATAGLSAWIWGVALAFVPPLHLYKQLRGAYGLSRFGALLRLFLLSILIVIVLILFAVLLFVLGLLG